MLDRAKATGRTRLGHPRGPGEDPLVVARTWNSAPEPRSFLELVSLPYLVSREVREARIRRRLQALGSDQDTGGLHRSLDNVIDFHHRTAMERLLAGVRLVAVSVLFVALMWSSGLLHSNLARSLIGVYALYALALFLLSWTRPERLMPHMNTLHFVDLGWATVATAVSGGTSSHVFPLFTFVLAASAYRWGLRRTLMDALAIALVATLQSATAIAGLTPWPFEFDWFVLWISCTFVLGVLLGMLSERQLALTFNAAAVGRVLARVTQASGLESAVQAGLAEVAQLLGARKALLVVEQVASGRLFQWGVESQGGHLSPSPRAEIPAEEREAWLFPMPASASTFEVRQQERDGRRTWASVGLDEQGRTVQPPFPAQAVLNEAGPWTSVIGAGFSSEHGWTGRLYVLDATALGATKLRLGLLQTIATHASPVLLQLYVLQGLRSRAADRERARLARELHDGPIQSLAGLSMRLDALRRRAEAAAPAFADDAAAVRNLLQEEAVRMRELMDGLKPVELDKARLAGALRDLVERFSRNSGLDGTLQWNVHSLDLTPARCLETYRVVQEALVNARRHGGATRVSVTVNANSDGWILCVCDNGQGMGFVGRVGCDGTRPDERSPRVIQERVAALGGSLVVDSMPSGTTLQIAVPHRQG